MIYRICRVGDMHDRLVVEAVSAETALDQARHFRKLLDYEGEEYRITEVEDRHPTVGHTFNCHGGPAKCPAWDSRTGFWMIFADGDVRSVSENAIGRTFHRRWE